MRVRAAGIAVLLAIAAQAPTADTVDSVLDLEPDVDNGRFVYQLCADCHTPQGWGLPDGSIPVISGQHRSVLVKQLADIRNGYRGNDSMYSFAQDDAIGGDQAIADVTDYISRLLMPPAPVTGPGERLDEGRRLYEAHCASCHGGMGEGDATRRYPRLQGQHFPYLVRQLDRMLSGQRSNADPAMLSVLVALPDDQQRFIADYLSRVRPAEYLLAPVGWENPDFNFGIQ